MQLGVNHATVSRKLAWLNATYGQNVFDKTPGGYAVSEFGQHLVSAAEDIEAITLSADRVRRSWDPTLAGRVTLSVSVPIARYLLADCLPDFVQRYPKIQLVLHASERQIDLDRSEADVVVRTTDAPPQHLVGRRLFPYAVCYYATQSYLAQTPEDQRRWIGTASDAPVPVWAQESPFPHISIGLRASGYELRHQALLAGLGMARGACFMADQEQSLVRLPDAQPFDGLDFWVLTHPDLRASPRIKATMRFLIEVLDRKKDLIQGRVNAARAGLPPDAGGSA